MQTIKRIMKNPYLLLAKMIKGRAHFLSDEIYLRIIYRACFGKRLNLSNPQTFNEKLQWLKIHDRNPLYSELVDKYEVKKKVSELAGEEYIIPTLGVWDSFEDICFEQLPNKFVLKCTHDSGGLVIVKDKNTMDVNAAKTKINKALKRNFFWESREWPYKNVKPRIIAEQYIEAPLDDLKDFKFFCFNGEPTYLYVASDRNKVGTDVKFDYFDMNFNRLKMRQTHHETSSYEIKKPRHFDEMVQLARLLSTGIPQVRIDMFEVNNQILFGEYTFFHAGGFVPFSPEFWDKEWGSKINISLCNH